MTLRGVLWVKKTAEWESVRAAPAGEANRGGGEESQAVSEKEWTGDRGGEEVTRRWGWRQQ